MFLLFIYYRRNLLLTQNHKDGFLHILLEVLVLHSVLWSISIICSLLEKTSDKTVLQNDPFKTHDKCGYICFYVVTLKHTNINRKRKA